MKSPAHTLFFLFAIVVSTCLIAEAQRRTIPAPQSTLLPVLQDGKWGYIAPNGRMVINPQFSYAYSFHEGLARVELNNQWGFIDGTGRMVIRLPPQAWYSLFSEGLSTLCTDAGTNQNGTIRLSCGYIDKAGRTVIRQQFDEAREFSGGLAAIKIGEQWGFIDHVGHYVINPRFDGVEPFRDGLAHVWNERDGHGFIDRSGKYLIAATHQMGMRSFSEGFAAVFVRGKWGYINKSGSLTISPRYDDAFPFTEGLALVIVDGKWGYIDKSGKLAIDVQFKPDENHGPLFKRDYDLPVSFSEGLAAVMVGRKWGYIDRTGSMVIPPQFDEPNSFSNGLAQVKVAGRVGYINKAGKYVWSLTK